MEAVEYVWEGISMSFWDSFQGLLGPQGFKGWQSKDLFDQGRWTPLFSVAGSQNPRTMREQTTSYYQPRFPQGGSLVSTLPTNQAAQAVSSGIGNQPPTIGDSLPARAMQHSNEFLREKQRKWLEYSNMPYFRPNAGTIPFGNPAWLTRGRSD